MKFVIAVELELPSTIKTHSIINVSRIQRYMEQVKERKREQSALAEIKGKEK